MKKPRTVEELADLVLQRCADPGKWQAGASGFPGGPRCVMGHAGELAKDKRQPLKLYSRCATAFGLPLVAVNDGFSYLGPNINPREAVLEILAALAVGVGA